MTGCHVAEYSPVTCYQCEAFKEQIARYESVNAGLQRELADAEEALESCRQSLLGAELDELRRKAPQRRAEYESARPSRLWMSHAG